MKYNKKKIIYFLFLFALGTLGRLLLKDIPNIETLTLASVLGGVFLGGIYAIILPLLMVAFSDIIIGNSPILLFTWSAWLGIGAMSLILKKIKRNNFSFILKTTLAGLGFNLFFYLWTNFGVWVMGNWYPKNFYGLIECYVMGLPFLKYQITGNLIFIPLASFSVIFLKKVNFLNINSFAK